MTGEARAETSMQVTQTRGLHVLEALTWSHMAIGAAMCRAATRLAARGPAGQRRQYRCVRMARLLSSLAMR
eukprot:6212933-Pleurochrysis_carterae.AAC.1